MTRQIGGFGEQLLAAFARFGGGPARMRLHAEADAALKRAGGDRDAALAAFERAVRDDPALMLEILDEAKFTRALLGRFLGQYAKRHGIALRGDGAGHGTDDDHSGPARPTDHRNAATAAGGGQAFSDTQSAAAPATNTAGAPDGRHRPGHARRSGAAMVAASKAAQRGILDAIRVNGTSLGDVLAGEALGWAAKQQRDAAIVERLCRHLDPDRTVRAQISDAQADQIAREADQ